MAREDIVHARLHRIDYEYIRRKAEGDLKTISEYLSNLISSMREAEERNAERTRKGQQDAGQDSSS